MRSFIALLSLAVILLCSCRDKGSPENPGVSMLPEVHASSGPVSISLAVHPAKLMPGAPLWFRLKLSNTGTKPFAVTEELFHSPFRFYKNLEGRFGLYLEAEGPDGRSIPVTIPRLKDDSGHRLDQISSKDTPDTPAGIMLQPGGSIHSPAWTMDAPGPEIARDSATAGLTQLPFFRLDKPGRYRIRAVYDWSSLGHYNGVRVATDWVSIEVRP